ncbi:integrin alpha [Marinicella sp. W31]|uniref:integrin alpha n=1 Tax=Marinicella sp. W31 TaxID=3023713 RepID=UPI0037571496
MIKHTFSVLIILFLLFSNETKAQFPANLNISELDGNNGVEIIGSESNEEIGRTVATIGDINGDGIDDVLIGSHLASTDKQYQNQLGRVYVVFGKDVIFSSNFESDGTYTPFDLQLIDGTNGFIIEGIEYQERLGRWSAGIGDFNADGLDDFAIGTEEIIDVQNSVQPFINSSGVYVFFGKKKYSKYEDVHNMTGSNGFYIAGLEGNSAFARNVKGSGDVNGDGFSDMIISDIDLITPDNNLGAAHVVFGTDRIFESGFDNSQSRNSLDIYQLDGSNGFSIYSNTNQSSFARYIEFADDINNDGFTDIMISARGYDNLNGSDTGKVYLIYGKENFNKDFNISNIDGTNGWEFTNLGFNTILITSGRLGDINGDNINDMAFMVYRDTGSTEKTVYVVFGSEQPFSQKLSPTDLDGSNGFIIEENSVSLDIGFVVRTAGDINSDGLDDVMISGPTSGINPTEQIAGKVFIVYGKSTPFQQTLELSDLDGTNGFIISGQNRFDNLGTNIAPVGDINHDGRDDIIIGALGADTMSRDRNGSGYIIYGQEQKK